MVKWPTQRLGIQKGHILNHLVYIFAIQQFSLKVFSLCLVDFVCLALWFFPIQTTKKIGKSSNVQNPLDIPLYCLLHRDPYNVLLESLYNWVVFHPYNPTNQGELVHDGCNDSLQKSHFPWNPGIKTTNQGITFHENGNKCYLPLPVEIFRPS